MESSDSDGSDADSFSSIQENLEQLSDLVTLFTKQLEVAEEKMSEIQPKLEDTHVSLLNGVPFLETSTFRNQKFLIKPPGLPGIDTMKRYAFKTICEMMRKYLFASNLVLEDGTIQVNEFLQSMLGIKESKVSYMGLLGHLQTVIV
jgi:hypothetical protein